MAISLEEAIEIHAKVLVYRAGKNAPHVAKGRAADCAKGGDHEGHDVWNMVVEVAASIATQPDNDRRH
jgi:hypothetical protein